MSKSERNIRVSEILNIISESDLDKISCETEVDKHVKKIKGKYIFSLFIYSFLDSSNQSLSKMANIFNSFEFRNLMDIQVDEDIDNTYKSTLSARLRSINPEFFEKIFTALSTKFQDKLSSKDKDNVIRFDSTIITLSSKLLGDIGYPVKNQNKTIKRNQIKFTVGLSNNLAKSVDIHGEDKNLLSENYTLRKAILSNSYSKDDVVVFDRGLQSREAFSEFSDKDISFVTRVNDNIKYKEISDNTRNNSELELHSSLTKLPITHNNLNITDDLTVQLFKRKTTNPLDNKFRLIKAEVVDYDFNDNTALQKHRGKDRKEKVRDNGSSNKTKLIYFLTNRFDLSITEVIDIYKKRWDIEVFFKFIKQNLHAKHFLSHNLNGIKVTFYMILIISLMLMIYKILNKINSYQDTLFHFKEEIKLEIYKAIAIISGGDPSKIEKIWSG